MIYMWYQSNELKLHNSVTYRQTQIETDKDKGIIHPQKKRGRSYRRKGGEKTQDLKLISVLPSQCSRATTVQALCRSLLSHPSLSIEVQQAAAVSLQEVRVPVCLWLKAVTHLNTSITPL